MKWGLAEINVVLWNRSVPLPLPPFLTPLPHIKNSLYVFYLLWKHKCCVFLFGDEKHSDHEQKEPLKTIKCEPFVGRTKTDEADLQQHLFCFFFIFSSHLQKWNSGRGQRGECEPSRYKNSELSKHQPVLTEYNRTTLSFQTHTHTR